MDGAMIASVGAEINILSSKMPTDIHSPVQYANDRDLVIPQKIIDHIGPYGIFEIAVADISGTPVFQTGCQSLESFNNFGMVDFSLS